MPNGAAPSAFDPVLAAAPHRIAKVTLVVNDLERVAEFYQRVIGLRLVSQGSRGARLGTDSEILVELRREPQARPRSPRDAGLFHTAFLLPERADLGVWLAFAQAGGIDLDGAADHTVSEAVYLADPEGNGIEIYADRPQAAWPNDDGTIAMANARLDFAGLAALARDRPWTGFPEGGVVGHVHLQVGELAPADAFYGTILGFDVTCRFPGASFFGSGGYHHQLAGNVWNSRGAPVRSEGSTGLAEVELSVDEAILAAISARVESSGIGADRGDGLTILDPWGTAIALKAG